MGRRLHFRDRSPLGGGRRSPAPPAGPAGLWIVSNEWVDVVGYSEEQMALASYSGAPAHRWWIDDFDGAGHGLLQLDSGAMVVASSEGSDAATGNGEESWWVTEDPEGLSGGVLASTLRRFKVEDFADWPALNYGARTISQLFDPNDVILGRGGVFARLTIEQIYGLSPAGSAPVIQTDPSFTGWSTQSTDNGDFWMGSDGDLFAAVATSAIGATDLDLEVTKIAQGNQIGSAAPNGLAGLVMDASGGIWTCDYNTATFNYRSAAVIGALTSTPSNPAPTRQLSSPAFNGAQTVFQMCLDNDGGMWVLTYEEPSRLLYFSAAKLLLGGPQTPDKVITTPLNYATSPCMRADLGPRR